MKHFIVAALIVNLCAHTASARLWTDQSGKQIEAQYVRQTGGFVVLQTPAGKWVKLSVRLLSDEDREYLKTVAPDTSLGSARSASAGPRTSSGTPEVVSRMKPGQTITLTAFGKFEMTYHVYVPTSFKSDAPPPIIIAFSPRGEGSNMVSFLQPTAQKADWLLVGCDKLSNDTPHEVDPAMGNELLDDILKNIPCQVDRKYLAGFSGGALRCYSYTTVGRRPEKYAGVLAICGWVGGDERLRRKYTPGLAVAQVNGDTDNNANGWAENDARVLRKNGCLVRAFPFTGGHEIAPPRVLDEVIAWFDAQAQNPAPLKSTLPR